jgi:hypothetical protein
MLTTEDDGVFPFPSPVKAAKVEKVRYSFFISLKS